MPNKILKENFPLVPTYCFCDHLNLPLQKCSVLFKFTQPFLWAVQEDLVSTRVPGEMFTSVRFCGLLPRRCLGSCTYERASLKIASCTNELIKSQTQTAFCLALVNPCKATSSRAIIQMSLGSIQRGKHLKYLSLSTLPLCLLSFCISKLPCKHYTAG